MDMSIVKATHNCYDHFELTTFEKVFTCDGCKMKGFGQRYVCNLCGQELHRECRFPKPTISHENFGCATFTFLDKPFTGTDKYNREEYSKCCDACGKDICGFSYHYKKNKMDVNCKESLDLHPCCRNLEKNLLIDDTIFNLRAKVSSKCIRCKKRKISGGTKNAPGWSYVSKCEKYHLHVYCMMEMVHEACMKHGGIMASERVKIQELVGSGRKKGRRTIFETIKSLVKIILSALLGDPTMLISNVFVELVSRGLQ